MPRGNYYRITKGYAPIEPTSFLERVFYVLWLLMQAFMVLLFRVRMRITKRNAEAGQEEH